MKLIYHRGTKHLSASDCTERRTGRVVVNLLVGMSCQGMASETADEDENDSKELDELSSCMGSAFEEATEEEH